MKFSKKNKAVIFQKVTPPTISYSPAEAILNAVIGWITLAVLFTSAMWMIGDVWESVKITTGGFLSLFLELLLCEVVFELVLPELEGRIKKRKVVLLRLVVVIPGLLLCFWLAARYFQNHSEEIMEGLFAVAQSYFVNFNRYYHMNMAVPSGEQESVSLALVYLFWVVHFIFWMITYSLRKRFIWVFFPMAVWVGEMLVGKTPEWKSLILFFAGLFFLSASNQVVGRIGKRKEPVGRRRKKHLFMNLIQRVLALLLFFAIIIVVSAAGKKPSEALMNKSGSMLRFQKELESRIKEGPVDFLTELFTNSKSVDNHKPSYRNKEIISITVDGPVSSAIYLKNFQGSVYSKGRWVSDAQEFEKACRAAGLDMEEIQELLVKGIFDREKQLTYQFSFQKRSNLLAAPYFVNPDDSDIKKMENDVVLYKKKGNRSPEIEGSDRNILSYSRIEELSNAVALTGNINEWNWYEQYVTEHYLKTSDKVPSARRMADNISLAEYTRTVSDINYVRYDAACKVAYSLSSFQYSLELPSISSKKDSVEYFLSESKEGYCVHFATAGVLILRELGIPARYASGYLVSQEQFRSNLDGTYTATVLDSDAHAWVEIYLNHIGWVPIEMTTGYGFQTGSSRYEQEQAKEESEEQKQESDESEDLQEESDEESKGEHESETETVQEVDTETSTDEPENENINKPVNNNQTDNSKPTFHDIVYGTKNNEEGAGHKSGAFFIILKIAVMVLLSASAVCGIVCLIRKIIENHRIKMCRMLYLEIKRKRYRKAVKKINRRLYKKVLRKDRLRYKGLSDAKMIEVLKQMYPQISEDRWDTYLVIVKEAIFSNQNPGEEKALFVYSIYETIEGHTIHKKDLSTLRRYKES